MNAFDALLADLARQLRELDPASQAEFFLQCGLALRPLYERWLDETGRPDRAGVLDTAALLVGEHRSAANTSLDAEVILTSMEAEFPPGDALANDLRWSLASGGHWQVTTVLDELFPERL